MGQTVKNLHESKLEFQEKYVVICCDIFWVIFIKAMPRTLGLSVEGRCYYEKWNAMATFCHEHLPTKSDLAWATLKTCTPWNALSWKGNFLAVSTLSQPSAALPNWKPINRIHLNPGSTKALIQGQSQGNLIVNHTGSSADSCATVWEQYVKAEDLIYLG